MSRRKPRIVQLVALAAIIVATAALWALLAPAQVGGRAGYIVITGNSMEPTFYAGDLAVIRRAPSYEVGDVVAYRHPEIGIVIHRIVERRGDRFVFQGDNNDFRDGYKPTEDELIGELWFVVPSLGSFLLPLKSPIGLGLATAFAIVAVAGGAEGRRRRPNWELGWTGS